MKKTYETPKAEVERYQLDASIASNCETVVHNGPQMNGYSQCRDYIDPFETYSAARSVHNVQFYSEDTCDCYTTAGGGFLEVGKAAASFCGKAWRRSDPDLLSQGREKLLYCVGGRKGSNFLRGIRRYFFTCFVQDTGTAASGCTEKSW